MQFINIKTEQLFTYKDMCIHARASVPKNPTDEQLSAIGFARVHPVNPPEEQAGKVVQRDGVEKVGGRWQMKWLVRDMNAAELKQSYINERASVEEQIKQVDLRSIRPTRDNEPEWIEKYKNEAAALRAQLAELSKIIGD